MLMTLGNLFSILALSWGLFAFGASYRNAAEFRANCFAPPNLPKCESGQECPETALRVFESYRITRNKCGVREANLPFIARTKATPAKGTVVLVHGLTANPAHLRAYTDRFLREGYNVVVPILSGHGGDDEDLDGASRDFWLRDVRFAAAVATALGGPVYGLGHSTGGLLLSIVASEQRNSFRALATLDPTLNLSGPSAAMARFACAASAMNVRFPSDLQELKNISNYRPELGCAVKVNRQLRQAIANLPIFAAIYRHCGLDYNIPDFNAEPNLRSVCALRQATAMVNREMLDRLPPSIVVLSKDEAIAGYVSQEQIREAVSRRTGHRLVESPAPLHGLMVAECSPGFEEYTLEILRWFADHRDFAAAANPN